VFKEKIVIGRETRKINVQRILLKPKTSCIQVEDLGRHKRDKYKKFKEKREAPMSR